MLGFPGGDALFRPAPVPLPPGARDPCRRIARARDGGRARALRIRRESRRSGHAIRKRPRAIRWARGLLGDRAGHHQRAQGHWLRGHRDARRASPAALGRPRRARAFDALLERVGQPGGPADPRRDHRVRRAAAEFAGAHRVRATAPRVASCDVGRRCCRPPRAVPVLMARTVTLPREVERVLTRHRQKVGARHAVRTADALVRMVDDLGFCFAFTGESAYPVPAAFDHLDTRSEGRKWDWMWGWKDELAENKRLYYGKLLVKKPTFVSMKMLPIFYATFGRAGDADDHLEDVRAGRLSEIARRVIEFLAVNGETQTKRMRSALGITSQEGKSDYAKAIEELQRLMYVARVRAVGEGREDYNYTYDLFVHRYPETVRAAERASSADAMAALLARLLVLAGGVTERQVGKLFDWTDDRVTHLVTRLETQNALVRIEGALVLPTLG